MCTPTEFIAAGFDMVAGNLAAEEQVREGAYAINTSRENARLARLAAADATTRGEQDAGRERMATSQEIGSMRTAFGASGVDGSVGSPLKAMRDTRVMSEMDALTIKNNAAREAWGYKMQAKQAIEEGDMALRRSKAQATGTLLGTYARVGSRLGGSAGGQ